jgi:putative transposase
MSAPPRTATSGTFFITATTYKRRRLFHVEQNAQLLLETLQHYRTQGLYQLRAFVVMPDHLHLLITSKNISDALRHIKGGFSRRLASKLPAWQSGFTDHLVADADEFHSRRKYIHANPVRAKLVTNWKHYPYSSAYRPETQLQRPSNQADAL